MYNKIFKDREYVLHDVNVVDVINSKVVPNVSVVVKDGKIASISKTIPEGLKVIECKGEYLLPGLINLHVHLFSSGKPSKTLNAQGGSQERTIKFLSTPLGNLVLNAIVKGNVRTELFSGTTTIRSVGDFLYSDVEQRDAINQGKYLGPRMLVSGPAITCVGGHGDGSISKHATTKEEYEALVDQNIAHHVDLIKIMTTAGVMDAKERGEAGKLRMNLESTKWVCDYAHQKGYKVASHVESTEGVDVALNGGVDTIEHCGVLTDNEVSLFKQLGKTITTTISPAVPYADLDAKLTNCSEEQKYNAELVAKGVVEGSKRALKEGIVCGLGTDASCPYAFHYGTWRELLYFVRYSGVTPEFAVKTVTYTNAQILGLDKQIGSVEVGKCADLILVKDNPFKNLRTLSEPQIVIARGTVVLNPHTKKFVKLDKLLDTLC